MTGQQTEAERLGLSPVEVLFAQKLGRTLQEYAAIRDVVVAKNQSRQPVNIGDVAAARALAKERAAVAEQARHELLVEAERQSLRDQGGEAA